MPNEVKLLPHEFTGRFVNGERICKWCSGTPRECSFVFGPLCNKRPTTVVTDEVVERVKSAICTELFERQGLGYDVPQGVNDGSVRIGGCVSLDGLARAAIASMPTVVTGEQPQDLGDYALPPSGLSQSSLSQAKPAAAIAVTTGTEAVDAERERIIRQAHERGDIIAADDGFFIYWPSEQGALNEWTLRLLADELERMNASWVEKMSEYFASAEPPAQPGDA